MSDDERVLVAALAAAESEMSMVGQRMEELHTEVKGLSLALERHRRTVKADRQPVNDSPQARFWRGMTRTDAILRVLKDGGEMHRQRITQTLHEMGREDDTVEDVSAALAYLARGDTPRVVGMGSGRWALVPAVHTHTNGEVMTHLPEELEEPAPIPTG